MNLYIETLFVNARWITFSSVFLILMIVHNLCLLSYGHEAKDFDDSILYQIDFAAIPPEEIIPGAGTLAHLASNKGEKFECYIPHIEEKREAKNISNVELSPLQVLQPIFASMSCSFRLEAYWSYEICHGYHVRQYHEEREGKNMKFQEFYLGKWTTKKNVEMVKKWEDERKSGIKYKTLKIDNINYPYFEMEFTDGTMCDIIKAPRTTLVRYVCYPHGKNEIYSFKEISSCRYEAIILTSWLCLIPSFNPEKSKELKIKCQKPNMKYHTPIQMLKAEYSDMTGLLLMWKEKKKIDTKVLELYNLRYPMFTTPITETQPPANEVEKDYKHLVQFIYGDSCLIGVTGWWNYEFCYGRYVRQFHTEKNTVVELFLGFFSEEAHKKWIEENPEKAPITNGTPDHIWHHYDGGTRCARTNQRRVVDVKYTCAPNANSPNAVSMYLLEPKTCVYILAVDSPIICDLMEFIDEYGLFDHKKLFGSKNENLKLPLTESGEKTSISLENIKMMTMDGFKYHHRELKTTERTEHLEIDDNIAINENNETNEVSETSDNEVKDDESSADLGNEDDEEESTSSPSNPPSSNEKYLESHMYPVDVDNFLV